MLKPRYLNRRPLSSWTSQWLCLRCQSRLQRLHRQACSISQPSRFSTSAKPPPPSPTTNLPSLPPNDEAFVPKPLSRPLGQSNPPQPGENSGIDHRTWRERRDDFFNYDKHLERRKELYIPPSPIYTHLFNLHLLTVLVRTQDEKSSKTLFSRLDIDEPAPRQTLAFLFQTLQGGLCALFPEFAGV